MALPPQFTPEFVKGLYRQHQDRDPSERGEWLHRELLRRRVAAYQGELEQAFAQVLGGGSPSLDIGGAEEQAAWAEHDAELRRLNPWLDDDNFERARQKARYIAWHDGP